MLFNIQFHNGGYCIQNEWLTGVRSCKFRKFQAVFVSFQHPDHGLCLIDTGYGPRIRDVAKTWAGRIFNLLLPIPRHQVFDQANYMALAHGIDESLVSHVFLSHFHADHIGGVSLFPNSRFVYQLESLKALEGQGLGFQVKNGYFKKLLPEWFDRSEGNLPSTSNWKRSKFGLEQFDYFGDGSLILLNLPGHALGHSGYLMNQADGSRLLYVVDAFWNRDAYTAGGQLPWLSRPTAHDYAQFLLTQKCLKALADDLQVTPYACHCPYTQQLIVN